MPTIYSYQACGVMELVVILHAATWRVAGWPSIADRVYGGAIRGGWAHSDEDIDIAIRLPARPMNNKRVTLHTNMEVRHFVYYL